MRLIYILIPILFAGLITACQLPSGHGDHSGHDHSDHGGHSGHYDPGHEEGDDQIHFTKEQIETIGLEFGTFSKIKVNGFIKVTGSAALPSNAYISVNTKTLGTVKLRRSLTIGRFVSKGNILATLEHPEILKKQQLFLELKEELRFLKIDYASQQRLKELDAGIEKRFQETKTAVNIKEIQLKGIEGELKYLGFNPSKINLKTLTSRIAIAAPASGFVSKINVHDNEFVQPGVELFELLNDKNWHLELNIFEQYIDQVSKGSKLSYFVNGKEYEALVSTITKELNPDTRTILVIAKLGQTKPEFIKDRFIDGKIWLNDNLVDGLPEDAVVRDGDQSLIYVSKGWNDHGEMEFEKKKVVSGETSNGFISVKPIDKIGKGDQIVTIGAYYVYAQSKAGQMKHEH